ncbi:assembly factor CBP4 [Suhomyces tanzawaensis NRRL Y-17324]|uniref:Cytochrome b mRNA-processing protein 4 n=1 Tax=Suhomyces tanzawaensis NRRL Y-17324 TaxID=984487 RepID=A0A1E4SN83_9ASCO|nr:assembly factor CBP4 [Suhomyces tanzawaensis NRRL Y-17324]ODV80973.1 assembly factor CBP4 [Suhomyces tanzawaensis NRRL Y-17324]
MSTKPLWYRWARVYFTGSCIVGTGVVLYKYTTPTDEELIAAFSPEIRAEYERNRELRQKEQAELMRIAKITSQSNDPIWKTGPIGSPFEKDQRNLNQQLIDYEQTRRESGNDQKRIEIAQAEQDLIEAENLAKKKSSWWRIGW